MLLRRADQPQLIFSGLMRASCDVSRYATPLPPLSLPPSPPTAISTAHRTRPGLDPGHLHALYSGWALLLCVASQPALPPGPEQRRSAPAGSGRLRPSAGPAGTRRAASPSVGVLRAPGKSCRAMSHRWNTHSLPIQPVGGARGHASRAPSVAWRGCLGGQGGFRKLPRRCCLPRTSRRAINPPASLHRT